MFLHYKNMYAFLKEKEKYNVTKGNSLYLFYVSVEINFMAKFSIEFYYSCEFSNIFLVTDHKTVFQCIKYNFSIQFHRDICFNKKAK